MKERLEKLIQFFREVRAELRRVTWPTRRETLGATSVVLVLVMIMSFFLGLVDVGLHELMRMILH
ncbi:MAG: preprotein translocase subunit SecE [Candidatus Methanomethylicota archaeon]|jgi:preprotein translocase subunit SecE|uniref:Protein translocase subunit SecE n=1 Tax=Thermoproteota archaeon TaxID=2056631 RepID=A0A523B7E6_9CREN|nr:MAG: preprotein translocase subunit SecE [Candidatus Verstraetearchaeota archaeon]